MGPKPISRAVTTRSCRRHLTWRSLLVMKASNECKSLTTMAASTVPSTRGRVSISSRSLMLTTSVLPLCRKQQPNNPKPIKRKSRNTALYPCTWARRIGRWTRIQGQNASRKWLISCLGRMLQWRVQAIIQRWRGASRYNSRRATRSIVDRTHRRWDLKRIGNQPGIHASAKRITLRRWS